MEKVLDVCCKPDVTSYSYYSYPLVIMKAKSRLGDEIARFCITQSADYDSLGIIKQNDQEWVVYSENDYLEDCNACIYRKLQDNDCIEIEIDAQQYTNSWGAVNLFIAKNNHDLLQDDEKFLYRFGNFIYNGINYYKNGKKMMASLETWLGYWEVTY